MRHGCIEVTQAIQTDRSRFLLRTNKSGTSPLGSDLKTSKKITFSVINGIISVTIFMAKVSNVPLLSSTDELCS